jgi:hypothetical protein
MFRVGAIIDKPLKVAGAPRNPQVSLLIGSGLGPLVGLGMGFANAVKGETGKGSANSDIGKLRLPDDGPPEEPRVDGK